MYNAIALMLLFGNFKSRPPHTLHTCECEHACERTFTTHTLPILVKLDELVDEVFDAAKEAEPMLKKFVVRLLPALADAL